MYEGGCTCLIIYPYIVKFDDVNQPFFRQYEYRLRNLEHIYIELISYHLGNAIASLVSRLRLERNFIVLKLSNLYAEDSDDDDGEEEEELDKRTQKTRRNKLKTVEVEVDLTMSAYANVTRMYGHKKVAQAKEIKTLQVANEESIIFWDICLYDPN